LTINAIERKMNVTGQILTNKDAVVLIHNKWENYIGKIIYIAFQITVDFESAILTFPKSLGVY
jgi:hypothetical protein